MRPPRLHVTIGLLLQRLPILRACFQALNEIHRPTPLTRRVACRTAKDERTPRRLELGDSLPSNLDGRIRPSAGAVTGDSGRSRRALSIWHRSSIGRAWSVEEVEILSRPAPRHYQWR